LEKYNLIKDIWDNIKTNHAEISALGQLVKNFLLNSSNIDINDDLQYFYHQFLSAIAQYTQNNNKESLVVATDLFLRIISIIL
jgi:hypothetical protein